MTTAAAAMTSIASWVLTRTSRLDYRERLALGLAGGRCRTLAAGSRPAA